MIGTDFETFMRVASDDAPLPKGTYIPVPLNVDIGEKHGDQVRLEAGSMHRDNVMVELCPHASASMNDLAKNIKSCKAEAAAKMSTLMEFDVELACAPSVEFSENDLYLAGENASEVGCDRDYLARQGVRHPRTPINANQLGTNRFSGGHIHISYNSAIKAPLAVHLCDLTLGTLEVLMGDQGKRKEFYGMPGLFRPKAYATGASGVEYRTLSSLWLSDNTYITAMLTNAKSTEEVLRKYKEQDIQEFLMMYWSELMNTRCIEINDAYMCQNFLEQVKAHYSEFDWVIGL